MWQSVPAAELLEQVFLVEICAKGQTKDKLGAWLSF